jgi:hypothetical protein
MGQLRPSHATDGVTAQKATIITMKNRRPFVLRATIVAAAFLAWGGSTSVVVATTPPPTTTPAAPDAATPPSDTTPQFVESWALSPAASDDPTQTGTRSNLSYEATPGSVIDDAVDVFNFGNVQLTFRVYGTDAFNNDQGQFDLLPGDQKPKDAGSWVTMSQGLITVPPGKQVRIPISIKVPRDATPGDHGAGIVASSESSSTDASGAVVKLDRRTGTRLYVRVSGPLNPEFAVTNLHTKYHHATNPLGGKAHVTFRVENRGNVRLGGSVRVSIDGLLGIGATTLKLPDLTELLPGEHVDLSADLADVPALMVDFTKVRVSPTAAAGVGAVRAPDGTGTIFAPPITFLLVVLVVLLGLLVRRAFRRRRAADMAPLPVHDAEVYRADEPQLQ